MCDAIVRLIPGAIGDEQSALSDSFQDNLLAPPVYTRPAEYKGWRVPDVLLSGHQRKIDEWKHEQSLNVPDAYARIYWNDILSSISVNIVAREVCESMYVAGVIV